MEIKWVEILNKRNQLENKLGVLLLAPPIFLFALLMGVLLVIFLNYPLNRKTMKMYFHYMSGCENK